MINSQDLAKLVDQYKRKYVKSHCVSSNKYPTCRLKVLKTCKRLEDCVRMGKKHHHKRMTERTIRQIITALKNSNLLKQKFSNFEELLDYVNNCIRGIVGIGQLAVYDISVRIGKYLCSPSIEPKDYVYLHRGALEGANKLFGGNPKLKEGRYPITIFPIELQKLGSVHIENFLCVMRNRLWINVIQLSVSPPSHFTPTGARSASMASFSARCGR